MKEKASLYLQVSEMTFLFPEEEMGKLSYLAYEWSYKRPRFDPSVYPNVYLHMQLPHLPKKENNDILFTPKDRVPKQGHCYLLRWEVIKLAAVNIIPFFSPWQKLVDHTEGTGSTLSFDCTILLSIDTYQTVFSSFASACSSSKMMGYETTESLLPFHWKMSVPQAAGTYSSYPFPPSQVRIPD